MERRYDWVVKFKELEYKYYRLAQGVQPKPDEPTNVGNELYIENVGEEAGTFSVQRNGDPVYTPNLEVKVGNSGWIDYNIVEGGNVEVSVPKGSKIYLRGNNPSGFNGGNNPDNSFSFTFSQPYNIGGYITSLLVVEDFQSINHIPDYAFCRLFSNTPIISAEDLITSNITSIGDSSFQDFFISCTSLYTAPTFEGVTSVGNNSFQGCFYNCFGLVTAPTFERVTSVGGSGFYACFSSCTTLVTSPIFSNVTSVGDYALTACFNGCSSIETIYAPSPSSWNTSSFENWVDGVPATGTFIKMYGVEIPSGSSGIPEGWTVEYVPEEFYIENIDTTSGYFQFFKPSTSTVDLNYKIDNGEWFEYDVVNRPRIEVLVGSKIYLKGNNADGFNPNISDFCRCSLFSSSTTTSSYCKCNIGGYITSLLDDVNYRTINHIPNNAFIGLVKYNAIVSAENLITSNITSVGNYSFMSCFYDCKSLVTPPTFENVTSVGSSGFQSCFNSCSALVTSPSFDNVTSIEQCGFFYCFQQCTKLKTIIAPCPSTWDTDYFTSWVDGVPTSGTFYKKAGLEIPSGLSGIPRGWTVVEV